MPAMMSAIVSSSPTCDTVPMSWSLANSQISHAAANAIGGQLDDESENHAGSEMLERSSMRRTHSIPSHASMTPESKWTRVSQSANRHVDVQRAAGVRPSVMKIR